MQPAILAKILKDTVGSNPFSDAIFRGEDVHVVLQQAAGLNSRHDAKRLLFQLVFGKPMNDVGRLFKGDTAWVDWVNSHKSQLEHWNPHKQDMHANLAWLLQISEAQVMSCIWNKLKAAGIPFLTTHDDVLCPVKRRDTACEIMDKERMLHFPKCDIVADHHKSGQRADDKIVCCKLLLSLTTLQHSLVSSSRSPSKCAKHVCA